MGDLRHVRFQETMVHLLSTFVFSFRQLLCQPTVARNPLRSTAR
jgi:hypothetical protein